MTCDCPSQAGGQSQRVRTDILQSHQAPCTIALNRTRPAARPAGLPVHIATQLDIETMRCDTG